MRLFFLIISSVASFFSAFSISFITDMLCTSNETSNYFLLLSFASPLSSIKTNTQYVSKLKSFSGSFSSVQTAEFFIITAVTIYFFFRSSHNVLYALCMGIACYLFSFSLSTVATKLSLMSSLRRDLQGPLKTIEIHVVRFATYTIAITALLTALNGDALSIGRPVVALSVTSVALYTYYYFCLRRESIYEADYAPADKPEKKRTKLVAAQLFISICMASWTSTDRWILGLADIPSEVLNTASWSQTVSIAFASIFFSSLYKYVKPKKFINIGQRKISDNQFFFISLFGILIIIFLFAQATSFFPIFERFFMIDGNNILGITLISVFFQRAGTFLVYQEESIRLNFIQGGLMVLAIIFSGVGFHHFVTSSILLSEISIMICSISWFLAVSALDRLSKGKRLISSSPRKTYE